MPTDEIIIRVFVDVDDQLKDVNNHPLAHLYPSEIVTIRLLFALKGPMASFSPSVGGQLSVG